MRTRKKLVSHTLSMFSGVMGLNLELGQHGFSLLCSEVPEIAVVSLARGRQLKADDRDWRFGLRIPSIGMTATLSPLRMCPNSIFVRITFQNLGTSGLRDAQRYG